MVPIGEFKESIGVKQIQFYKRDGSPHQYARTKVGGVFIGNNVDTTQPLFVIRIENVLDRPDLNNTLWIVNKDLRGNGIFALDSSLASAFIPFRDYFLSVGGESIEVYTRSGWARIDWESYTQFGNDALIIVNVPHHRNITIKSVIHDIKLTFSRNLINQGDFTLEQLFNVEHIEGEHRYRVFLPRPNEFYLTVIKCGEIL